MNGFIMVRHTCLHCGQSYSARRCEVITGRAKYCSRQCKALEVFKRPTSGLSRRERGKVSHKVHHALKSGTLAKAPCEKCGSPKAESHHPDYSKPLKVQWLCRKCHHLEHHRNPDVFSK
jgi:hypothetical protein